MHQAHKIRLNPTPDQAAYFRRATGTQRFVFNWGLARIKEALDAGETPPHVLELKKAFNAIKGEQFPWVYEVTKCAVEGGFQNLQAALSNFFQSKKGQRKGKRMGFPHRKSRKRGYGSLTLANDKVSHEGHTVTETWALARGSLGDLSPEEEMLSLALAKRVACDICM